jgi:hypothetical protein
LQQRREGPADGGIRACHWVGQCLATSAAIRPRLWPNATDAARKS